ncbi:MAG: hypothetical protein ACYCT9_00520 [Leptospirillum sp.]|jgi:hypothetical protein
MQSTKIGKGYLNFSVGGKVTINNEIFSVVDCLDSGKFTLIDEAKRQRGAGQLNKNTEKKSERSPDFIGYIRIDADEFEAIAYSSSSVSISVFKSSEG